MTANQFRTALDRLHLTQEQAATFLCRSLRTINGYCNGKWIDPLVVKVINEALERQP
jgi:hypothetical protein